MISKTEFEQKFNTEFKKEKAIFKKHQARAIIWMIIATIIVVGACVGLHFLLDPENENWIIYVLAGIFSWFCLAALPVLSRKDKLIKGYKKFDLGKLLSIIYGEKIFYLSSGYVDKELFINSAFTNSDFDTYGGEDLFGFQINGKRKGEETTSAFIASDVKAQKTIIGTDGKTETRTIFDGTFCAVHFRKPFKCTLELNAIKKKHLKPLETESAEFNKKFHIQTDDQIEARLILTLPLMDKLLKYSQQTKKKMGFSFHDDHLYIYIEKELFHLSDKDDSFNFKLVEPIYDDLALFEDIATEIESNRKIFKI